MDKGYYEFLVKGKPNMGAKVGKVVFFILALLSLVAALLFGSPILIVVTIAFGIGTYFTSGYTDVEYEYLYCDKTITVSKIMAKEKRKDLETFDIDKMEILAPANSYRLGDFKNRDLKEVNYWSVDKTKEEPPYAMIYEGGRKILLDLPQEFVKMVQNNAPRKVFFD